MTETKTVTEVKDDFPIDASLPYNVFVQNVIIKGLQLGTYPVRGDAIYDGVNKVLAAPKALGNAVTNTIVATATSSPFTVAGEYYGKMWVRINKVLEHF